MSQWAGGDEPPDEDHARAPRAGDAPAPPPGDAAGVGGESIDGLAPREAARLALRVALLLLGVGWVVLVMVAAILGRVAVYDSLPRPP